MGFIAIMNALLTLLQATILDFKIFLMNSFSENTACAMS